MLKSALISQIHEPNCIWSRSKIKIVFCLCFRPDLIMVQIYRSYKAFTDFFLISRVLVVVGGASKLASKVFASMTIWKSYSLRIVWMIRVFCVRCCYDSCSTGNYKVLPSKFFLKEIKLNDKKAPVITYFRVTKINTLMGLSTYR